MYISFSFLLFKKLTCVEATQGHSANPVSLQVIERMGKALRRMCSALRLNMQVDLHTISTI